MILAGGSHQRQVTFFFHFSHTNGYLLENCLIGIHVEFLVDSFQRTFELRTLEHVEVTCPRYHGP